VNGSSTEDKVVGRGSERPWPENGPKCCTKRNIDPYWRLNLAANVSQRIFAFKVEGVKMAIFCAVICNVTNYSTATTHAFVLLLKVHNKSTNFTWKNFNNSTDIHLLNSV